MDRETRTHTGHLTVIYAIARALCRFAVEKGIDGSGTRLRKVFTRSLVFLVQLELLLRLLSLI